MKKSLKIILTAIAVLLVIFFSLDIRSLDGNPDLRNANAFEVEEFSGQVWERLPAVVAENALETGLLILNLNEDANRTFLNHGKKLGISKTWYFLTYGEGTMIQSDGVTATVRLDDQTTIELATLYLFGNAIRESSGLVDISDFLNMMDFNQVSVHLNNIARKEVVDPFLTKAAVGQRIIYSGALEVSENSLPIEKPVIIPISISVEHE